METKLKRKDIIIIGVVAIIVCFFVTIAVVGSGSSNRPHRPSNFGFGPSWDCRPMPFGGPVCIRRLN
jgi:hypothetical protein